MIRHAVLFTWTPEATEAQKQQVADEVAKLPLLVETVRAFDAGPDVGVNKGNADFAVAADFDDVEGYVAYRDNPDHRAIVEQYILPIAATRTAIQYEF
jgi:hypothetical protein